MSAVASKHRSVPSSRVPARFERGMKDVGGSEFALPNTTRLAQAMNSTWKRDDSDEALATSKESTILTLMGIDPQDDLEGMLAAQMLAVHNATMECFRRAMVEDQHFDHRERNLNFANKLSRTFTMQVEALQRYRGKGQQKVTVEHVHIHSGANAVIGSVTPGG